MAEVHTQARTRETEFSDEGKWVELKSIMDGTLGYHYVESLFNTNLFPSPPARQGLTTQL